MMFGPTGSNCSKDGKTGDQPGGRGKSEKSVQDCF